MYEMGNLMPMTSYGLSHSHDSPSPEMDHSIRPNRPLLTPQKLATQRRHISSMIRAHPYEPDEVSSSEYADDLTAVPSYQESRKPIPSYELTRTTSKSSDPLILSAANKPTWRPAYLKLPVLLLFQAIFCLLLAFLELLHQLSQRRQGLTSPPPRNHYSWTYGPSAVFIVLAALWTRVEYQIKDVVPWMSMVEKQARATKSILLDYVSPIQPVAMYRALRNRHYVVFAGAVCSLFCRVLIVFASSLLVLSPVSIQHDGVPMTFGGHFNGSVDNVADRGFLPYFWLDGLINKQISYPPGLTSSLAYIPFNTTEPPFGVTMQAKTTVLQPDLRCVDAGFETMGLAVVVPDTYPSVDIQYDGLVEISTPDCTVITNITSDQNTSFHTLYQLGACADDPADWRLVVAAFETIAGDSYNDTFSIGSDAVDALVTNLTVIASKQIICEPVYGIKPALVTMNPSKTHQTEANVLLLSEEPGSTLPALPAVNFTWAQQDWLLPDDAMVIDSPFLDNTGVIKQLQIGMKLLNPQNNVSAAVLLQEGMLANASTSYFCALSAIYTALTFVVGETTNGTGAIQIVENRLLVEQLAVRVMQSILATMALLNIYIIFRLRRPTGLPRRNQSLLDMAILLKYSSTFTETFRHYGSTGMSDLQQVLADQFYMSGFGFKDMGHHFVISRVCKGRPVPDQASDQRPKSQIDIWHPLVISFWGKAGACIALASLVLVLQVTYQTSQKNGGLGNATFEGYVHYTWSYAPAILFVSISMWFSSIDFNIRCLGPFFSLRGGKDVAKKSVDVAYLDATTPTTLFQAALRQNWIVFSTTLAAFLASLLTIAVSGVFLVHNVPQSSTVLLQATSSFSANDTDIIILDGQPQESPAAATAYSNTVLIFHAESSYPQWTYDELAFPQLEMLYADSTSHTNVVNGTVTTRVTATRSMLECRADVFRNITYNATTFDDMPALNISFWGCSEHRYFLAYFGYYFGIAANPRNEQSSCYDNLFTWGYVNGNGTVEALSLIGCNASFYDVDVDVHFSGPNMTIDTTNPPVADLGTLRPSTAVANKLEFLGLPSFGELTDTVLDEFFSAVIYGHQGRDGVSVSDLGISANATKVTDGIKHIYSQIQAQRLNAILRAPLEATTIAPLFNATLLDTDRLRVVQDRTSTRILQGLLGAMLVCMLMATALTRGTNDEVVPKNPCSIAATTSLLADSGLVRGDVLPQNVDRLSEKQVEALVKHMRFGLGWFDNDKGGQTFKIDVVNGGEKPRWTYDYGGGKTVSYADQDPFLNNGADGRRISRGYEIIASVRRSLGRDYGWHVL